MGRTRFDDADRDRRIPRQPRIDRQALERELARVFDLHGIPERFLRRVPADVEDGAVAVAAVRAVVVR